MAAAATPLCGPNKVRILHPLLSCVVGTPSASLQAACLLFSDAEQVVLAESYENEAYWLGKGWTTPMKVPHESDALRQKPQPKDKVVIPPGWMWKGDWEIDPEIVRWGSWLRMRCPRAPGLA